MKFGARFSVNAAMPSVWSSVANAEWNSRRSYSRPSASVLSKARLTASFAIRDAESAAASLEAFARNLRSSPGYFGLLEKLGIKAKDASGNMRDTVDDMRDLGKALEEAKQVKATPFAWQNLGRNKTIILIFFNSSLLRRVLI